MQTAPHYCEAVYCWCVPRAELKCVDDDHDFGNTEETNLRETRGVPPPVWVNIDLFRLSRVSVQRSEVDKIPNIRE
jgi:hypothetical protein